MQVHEVEAKVATMMPELLEVLRDMVAMPSVAFPGYPPEPVVRMADEALRQFREAGFDDARLMEAPTGFQPIYAELQGPPGSPVVVLYAHYDVQPAPEAQGWTTDPWTAVEKDGR